jgi:chemotaxis protein MotB
MQRNITSNTESLGQPAWLLTFSDLITLMLTFFVLRYAVASGNNLLQAKNLKEKEFIVSINPEELVEKTPFVIANNQVEDVSSLLYDKLQENNSLLIAVDISGFEAGTQSLTFKGTVAIKSLAKVLNQKNLSAFIQGLAHKGHDELGSNYSEWDLAGARAMAIYRQLVDANVSPYTLSLGSKVLDNKEGSKQQSNIDLVRIVIFKP